MRLGAVVGAGLTLLAALAVAENRSSDRGEADSRFEFGAELRARAETRSGIGENPDREDGFSVSRLRLDFTYRPRQDLEILVQAQDSRAAGLRLGPTRNPLSFRNPLDLRQAYVALGREDGPWSVQAGRRELSLIGGRVLGPRGWSNVSPPWDGSMLTLRQGAGEVRLLAYSQVDIREGFDTASRTRFVYGVVGSAPLPGGSQSIEPFFLTTRQDIDRSSHLGGMLRTVGLRFAGATAEKWDYQVVLAAQGGGERDLPHRAWAGTWEVGRTIRKAQARPRVGVEWSYASGDRDPLDGRSGTFDTLFPSPHAYYGEQDLVGFRNLQYLGAGVQLHPDDKLQVDVNLIDLRLASRRDGLYQTDQAMRAAPPSGGAGSGAVGSELDLVLLYRPAPRVELRFGVSRFFAGRYVTTAVPGGESQTFLNTALTVRL